MPLVKMRQLLQNQGVEARTDIYLTDEDYAITAEYMQRALAMCRDHPEVKGDVYPHTRTINNLATDGPSYDDVRRLNGQTWLSGVIMNRFMLTLHEEFDIQRLEGEPPRIIIASEVYSYYVASNDYRRTLHIITDRYPDEPYTFFQVQATWIVNIIDSHWFSILWTPFGPNKGVRVRDPMGLNRPAYVHNIIKWYSECYAHFGFQLPHPLLLDMSQWPLTYDGNIMQTDGTSCGVFTSMAIYNYFLNGTWPTSHDWTQRDVPNMRAFMFNRCIQDTDSKQQAEEAGGPVMAGAGGGEAPPRAAGFVLFVPPGRTAEQVARAGARQTRRRLEAVGRSVPQSVIDLCGDDSDVD